MRRRSRTPQDALASAFAATPRRAFLPVDQHRFAGNDLALPIGFAQTNSQPRTVRAMLRLLDVRPGQRVLDVGSGSGWTTCLLARLVGATGEVVGVEIVPELVDFGRANLAAQQLPHARIEPAVRQRIGLPDLAPFDRILVSAEARRLPSALVTQLAVPGGVLVIPVAGWMQEVRPAGEDEPPVVVRHGAYSFVPLVGG